MKILFVIVFFIFLQGCASSTHWVHPDTPKNQDAVREIAYDQCLEENQPEGPSINPAKNILGVLDGSTAESGAEAGARFRECMMRKGYHYH